MTIGAKWIKRDYWKLLQAAQLVAGLDPIEDAKADNPNHVLPLITDSAKRNLVEEVYDASKNAIQDGSLKKFLPPRTGLWGNTRVSVSVYLAWAKSRGWTIPPELAILEKIAAPVNDAMAESSAELNGEPEPVHNLLDRRFWINRNAVMDYFPVKVDNEANEIFWEDKLGRPPEWLKTARMFVGRPGVSSLWNPILVAHCLLDHKAMNLRQLDQVMHKHFSALNEQWKEETEDKR